MYKYTLYFKNDSATGLKDGYVSSLTDTEINYTTKRAECLSFDTEEGCRQTLAKARKVNQNIHIKFMVFRYKV